MEGFSGHGERRGAKGRDGGGARGERGGGSGAINLSIPAA